MKFLGNVLAVIVGLFVFSIVAMLIFFGIIGLVASSSEKEVTLEKNSILHLDLNGRTLVERTSEEDLVFGSFLDPFGGENTAGLVNLKKAIGEAKTNENVKGIYLNAGLIGAGQAGLLELREALIDFKTSGKFIVAYDEAYSEGGYFLASVADEIYLNPLGGIDFNGFSSEGIFLKGFFEKVGIKPEVFRVGEFKSAVEPFILDKMSPENRLQTQYFLDDINNHALELIAKSGGIAQDSLVRINQQMLVRKPKDAVTYKLATALKYEDEVHSILKEKLGLKEDDQISTINATDLGGMAKSKNITSSNRIAVILAEGEIVDGNADGAISSEKFAKENNIEIVDTSYFFYQSRWDEFIKIRDSKKIKLDNDSSSGMLDPFNSSIDKYGTVGCVVMDRYGNLAAGTSTGGIVNKDYNRIGDSPIIGAGTYANNKTCAISCTGHGEMFIRSVAAYDVSCLMEYKGLSLQAAMEVVVHEKLMALNGEGGMIGVDAKGNTAMVFNSAGMYRAFKNSKGESATAIYK